jgi:hypothetical protein
LANGAAILRQSFGDVSIVDAFGRVVHAGKHLSQAAPRSGVGLD